MHCQNHIKGVEYLEAKTVPLPTNLTFLKYCVNLTISITFNNLPKKKLSKCWLVAMAECALLKRMYLMYVTL